ncbi:MAG: efflux RND transporter periplasmic adaptor subunit [Pseudomonadota bacterium]|nr:efflux RND transporter periplasmic adaptor subunit [Pseudomonadota bacterium]
MIFQGTSEEGKKFKIERVERGDITRSISASGQLNPVMTVNIGSEISGQISELLVDYNTEVKSGQVIARIDSERFEAEVLKSEAELSVAQAVLSTKLAAIKQSEANLANENSILLAQEADAEKSEVSSADLKLDYQRKAKLRTRGVVSVSEVDKAKAAWEVSVAQFKSSKAKVQAQQSMVAARTAQLSMSWAEVKHAKSSVEQKKAELYIANIQLENTYIRSPLDGVVIGKDIDVGQIVAASLQAPTLFTIAKDLKKMQVDANIDEADIGEIVNGQSVSFAVDAYPGRKFLGTVRQVRKKPQEVQNVITYTVVIEAENNDFKLLPGMTASVEIRVSNRKNVLKIPTRALRFTPSDIKKAPVVGKRNRQPPNLRMRREQAQARLKHLAKQLNLTDNQKEQVRNLGRQMGQRIRAIRQSEGKQNIREIIKTMRRQNSERIMALLNPEQKKKFRNIISERLSYSESPGKVWILAQGEPKVLNIMIGVGDDKFYELRQGDLKEGQEVIVGEMRGAFQQ